MASDRSCQRRRARRIPAQHLSTGQSCRSARTANPTAAHATSEISCFSSPKKRYNRSIKKFTAILHQGEPDEGGFWATCLEVPGANGQGETKECLVNLKEAIRLLLETEREEVFRLDPQAETAELVLA